MDCKGHLKIILSKPPWWSMWVSCIQISQLFILNQLWAFSTLYSQYWQIGPVMVQGIYVFRPQSFSTRTVKTEAGSSFIHSPNWRSHPAKPVEVLTSGQPLVSVSEESAARLLGKEGYFPRLWHMLLSHPYLRLFPLPLLSSFFLPWGKNSLFPALKATLFQS